MEKVKLLKIYRKMLEIRRFEEKLYSLFLTGIVPGTMHQYIGQEAIAVGVCENLRENDYVTTTHRGHGHYLAKGAPLKELMAELFAKKTGCCRGMGGSMHIAKLSSGILGGGGIVGAGIPIACGAALSAKIRKKGQIVACFFGDGAVNTGAFHEGVNLAAVWKLPIIFVCENNLYAFSTPIKEAVAIENIAERARGYGIPGIAVNGNDVLEVYEIAYQAIKKAREGRGPTLIECKTYRYKGHARFDPGTYRPREEVEEWLRKDPLVLYQRKLIKMGIIDEKKSEEIEQEVRKSIEEAIKFAKASPEPDIKNSLEYVYA